MSAGPSRGASSDAMQAFLRAAWAEAFNAEAMQADPAEPVAPAVRRLRAELDAMLPPASR
jgi:hypothetical protein